MCSNIYSYMSKGWHPPLSQNVTEKKKENCILEKTTYSGK